MNVTFTYTYSDYLALIKAMEKHGRFSRYSWIALYLVIFVNFAASAVFIYLALTNNRVLELAHFVNAGLAILLILIFYVFKPLYLRRYYKKQMIDGKQISLDFSDRGLEVAMPSFNGTHEWPAIIRADEGPEHFLLWINKVQAYCIPKRGFAKTQDIEDFKSLVAEKVPNQEFIK